MAFFHVAGYMALSAQFCRRYLSGVALMYIFGFGTLPMLIGITLLKTRLPFTN